MAGKRFCLMTALMALLIGSGCCRWCDRRQAAQPICCPCPVAPAPVCCPPVAGPTCYTPGVPATVASGTQWQRTPGANGCCP
ncbi:MAG: hypothetical protein FJ271_08165 [Planctomycetes bacterium]|nr:hypothetical protein [Planctomycetota bacterium]